MPNFLKVNEELGLVLGFAIVCKIDGEDYFDTQGDHIPEETMLKESMDFMLNSRNSKDMHMGGYVQKVAFAYPITTDISKTFGFDSSITGLLIGLKPAPDVLEKYRDGTYTGFSIGGKRGVDEDVEGNVLTTKSEEPEFWKKPGEAYEGDKKKKKVMRTFKLDEISSVDRPAQAPALVRLLKRDNSTDLDDVNMLKLTEGLSKLSVLTSESDKHQHGINLRQWVLEEGGDTTSYDGGTFDSSHNHPYIINDDGTITIGMVQGHTHTVDLTAAIQHMRMVILLDKKAEKSVDIADTVVKTSDEHFASDFALVPDANDPLTWKFKLARKPGGNPDRRLVGQVVAEISKQRCRALRKLSDDDRATVIRRVRKAWQNTNPHKSNSDMPSVLKQATR